MKHKTALEYFDYNEHTGKLTWKKVTGRGWARKGTQAGHLPTGANTSPYRVVGFKYKNYLVHRIIWLWMTGEEADTIDHVNGDPIDNRWCNLRSVSHQENLKNKRLRTDNTSGVCGVSLDKRSGKWVVAFRVNGKRKHFGRYADKEEAALVAKREYTDAGYHQNHGLTAIERKAA